MGFSFFASRFYGVQRSNVAQTDSLSEGLLVAIDTPVKDSCFPYQYKAAVSTNVAVGVVLFTHTFKVRVPVSWVCNGNIRCKVKWRVNAAAAAGALARVQMDIKKSGAAITGLTAYNGSDRALDVIADFTECWMVCAIPTGISFKAGDSIEVELSWVNRANIAGAALEVYVYCDPGTSGDELVIEFDTLTE